MVAERPIQGPVGTMPVPAPKGRSGPPSRRRIWLARAIALAADAVQIVLLPFVMGGAMSPVDDILDVGVAIVMIGLLGWHWAFVPAFIAELFPMFDLAPTWTLAVFIATRGPRD
jgi:hypothetical protein